MGWSEVILLSAAMSIDGFSVGTSCGLSGIRTTKSAKLTIMCILMVVTGIGVLGGWILGEFLPDIFGKVIGSVLLSLVGLYMIVSAVREMISERKNKSDVLNNPEFCDTDHSSTIEPSEAIFIALTLSADAFGAGIGAGASGGCAYLVPFLCGIFHISFLTIGEKLAGKLRTIGFCNRGLLGICAGIILIMTSALRFV